MIRDPSDGTVRNPHGESPSSRSEQSGRVAEGANSGLPTDKLKAEELARLERAREWLKEWKGRNGT